MTDKFMKDLGVSLKKPVSVAKARVLTKQANVAKQQSVAKPSVAKPSVAKPTLAKPSVVKPQPTKPLAKPLVNPKPSVATAKPKPKVNLPKAQPRVAPKDFVADSDINKYVEKETAKATKRSLERVTNPAPMLKPDTKAVDAESGELIEHGGITLDASQTAAVNGILKHQFSCLIGEAGTGKTTVTKALIARLEKQIGIVNHDKVKGVDEFGNDIVVTESIMPIACCASTGKAMINMRGNMEPHMRPNCMTIHRLLGYHPEKVEKVDKKTGETRVVRQWVPHYTAENKLPYKVIVIDEISMVTGHLWNQLWEACEDDVIVIVIGDLNQLPPVGGKSTFSFMLEAWPIFELTTIHRTKNEDGTEEIHPVIKAAHAVLDGKHPPVELDGAKRFQMVPIPLNEAAAQRKILQVVKHFSDNGVFNPDLDGILTPANIGLLGQVELNRHARNFLNPYAKDSVLISGADNNPFLAVGEKVMALQNDWTSGINNGMTGKVTEIYHNMDYPAIGEVIAAERQLEAYKNGEAVPESVKAELLKSTQADMGADDLTGLFNDDVTDEEIEAAEEAASRSISHVVKVAFYEKEKIITEMEIKTRGAMNTLGYGYAATCHKAQGSEYPLVFIVVHSSQSFMLNREWLYTAITRAKQRCIILYDQAGLNKAVKKQRIKGRTVEAKAASYVKLCNKTKAKAESEGEEVALPIIPKARQLHD